MKKLLQVFSKTKPSDQPTEVPVVDGDSSENTTVGAQPFDSEVTLIAQEHQNLTPPPLPEASEEIQFPELPDDVDLEASFAAEAEALSRVDIPIMPLPSVEPIVVRALDPALAPKPPPLETPALDDSPDIKFEEVVQFAEAAPPAPLPESVSGPHPSPVVAPSYDFVLPDAVPTEPSSPELSKRGHAKVTEVASMTAEPPPLVVPGSGADAEGSESRDTQNNAFPFVPSPGASSSLGKIDKAILAASFAVLFGSVFLLFSDGLLMDEAGLENLVPVGQFSKSSNDVRRKVDNGLTFHPVGESDQVFEGDSIFTGDDSEAQVNLDHGGSLVIDPKSLIVVRTRDGGLEVDLQYGSLVGKLQSDKPIVIMNEGKRSEISTTNAELRITKSADNRSASIDVLSGEVKVKDAGSKTPKTIRQNESAVIDKSGITAAESFAIILKEPGPGVSLWAQEPISFRWEAAASEQNYVFELSRDATFKKPLARRRVDTTEVSFDRPPDVSGPLYWRVRTEGEKESRSLPRRIAIYPDTAPVPMYPVAQHSFVVDSSKGINSQAVRMTWKDAAASKEWTVQVALDPDFQTGLIEKTVKRTNWETEPLSVGQYYWRVKGVHPERVSSLWSETSTYSVLGRERPLIAPKVETSITTYVIPEAKLLATARDGKLKPILVNDTPPFKWDAVPGADQYVIELDLTEKFANPTQVKVGKERSYRLERVRPETYYWRVRSISLSGKESKPSAHGQFVVTLPPPKPTSQGSVVQKFENQKAALRASTVAELEWPRIPFAKGYQIRWSRDEDFREFQAFNSGSNSKKIVVRQEGKYYYRVRVLDKSAAPISDFSEPESFDYIKEYPDPAVVAAREKAAQEKAAQEKLAKEKELARLAKERENSRAPSAISPKPFETGPIGLGTSNIPAPKLREPRPGTSVVALGKSPVFVQFSWRPTKGAVRYRVEISTTPEFSKTVASATSREPKFFMEKNLPSGRFYWRVRAEFKSEHTDWSQANTFTVAYK